MRSRLSAIPHRVSVSGIGIALLGGLAIAIVGTTPAAHAAPQDQVVTIDSFAFAPSEISAPVGSTLTWTNAQAGVPHTTTSIDGAWDSGVVSTGNSFSFKFDQAGDFAYQCLIHPSMRGTVHIVAAALQAAPAEPPAAETSSAVAEAQAPDTSITTTEDASATNPVAVAPPTVAPTLAPTVAPTPAPTVAATLAPTLAPTPAPTARPAKPTPTSSYGY